MIYRQRHAVICYDSPDARRRRAFAAILEEYGARIQFSVFEVRLKPALFDKLIEELRLGVASMF